MALADWIDAAIEPFSPRAVVRRRVARIALENVRQYDAAQRDRRTQGWKRPGTSADAEDWRARAVLAYSTRDLVRNNKYAAAAKRKMVSGLIGDGVSPQFHHDDKAVAQKAQDGWDRWAESPVDGFGDFYEGEKLAVGGMLEGGEALMAWEPDATGPDGRVRVLEGDFIDSSRMGEDASGARTIQGVVVERNGDRSGYWLFDQHPGDYLLSSHRLSTLHDARNLDHVFERTRPGQTRGVSRFAAVAMTLRDVEDIADAIRLKRKLQACIGMVITPADGDAGSPVTGQVESKGGRGPDVETIRPGLIMRLKPGETSTGFQPDPDGDGVEFIRQQLAAVSASMVPYYLMTGDTSGATYSNLRAASLGWWADLDDLQSNVIVPRICKPAVARRMRRTALELGDRRILQCTVTWSFPVRRQVDPLKDLMAECMEIRAGLKTLAKSLAERGINADAHMAAIAQMNALIDKLGIVSDVDPRKVDDKGMLQIAAGYIAPKGEQA